MKNDQPCPIRDAVANGRQLADTWGLRPGEWFVCTVNRKTGMCGLAKTANGYIVGYRHCDDLRFPDGSRSPHFYPGDMVRTADE